jgi:hypothetical protein
MIYVKDEATMPFFALVNAAGETIRVVMNLDEPVPPGLVAVELPAPGDRVHLAEATRDRGGGAPGHEVQTGLDEGNHEKAAPGPDRRPSAEEFFSRLEMEVRRARQQGTCFSVLLFDLAPADRERADAFVRSVLRDISYELLPVDFIASLRPHLTAVLLRDVDTGGGEISPVRGHVTSMRFPNERQAIAALLSRRHPLLAASRAAAAQAAAQATPATEPLLDPAGGQSRDVA